MIAPASANTIAKLAAGHADNLLTAAALACRRPLIVAPAMNDAMYEHAATRANLETLRARGVEVLEPGTGALGSPGEWGVGRLPEPAELLAAIEARLGATAGGSLDGLRCSSPPAARASRSTPCASSATARRAAWAGRSPRRPPAAARTSPSSPPTSALAAAPRHRLRRRRRPPPSSPQACRERFPTADVLLMAAAVADYRPATAREDKIKKAETGETLTLELERTEDVLSALAAERRPDQLLVGFAAEHGERAVANARDKLERKRLDAVVVNDVSAPGHRVRRA